MGRRPGWARFLLPSAADLVFLGLLFSLCCGTLAPRLLGDAGIGWHIRNGEWMLRNHAITRTDPFSSTMGGRPWYAWEWLYDLVIAGIHHWMGLNGVVFFTALVIAAAFALTLRFAMSCGGDLPVAIVLLALAVGASAIHLFARPHVLSWLLVVLWFALLDSWEREGDQAKSRKLLWLPALMVLWVNVHGGFLTGFALLGLYLVAQLFRSFAVASRPVAAKRLKVLGSIGLLALASTFLNPYGYRLHVHIYGYVTDRFLMNHIDEFRSPDFHGLAQQCFVVLLMIAIAALATASQKPRLSHLLVIIFAAGSGLYAARNLPISALLLTLTIAPILSRTLMQAGGEPNLADWLRTCLERSQSFATRMGEMEASLRGHLWPVAGILFGLWICLHGGSVGGVQIIDAHFPPKRFPIKAVDVLAEQHAPEPVFCPDYWGGYVIYRLYPQTRVVVDDRHDLYGAEFFKQYLKVVGVEPGWQETLDQDQVKVALLPTGSALAYVLGESPGWRMVFEDKVGTLFRRN